MAPTPPESPAWKRPSEIYAAVVFLPYGDEDFPEMAIVYSGFSADAILRAAKQRDPSGPRSYVRHKIFGSEGAATRWAYKQVGSRGVLRGVTSVPWENPAQAWPKPGDVVHINGKKYVVSRTGSGKPGAGAEIGRFWVEDRGSEYPVTFGRQHHTQSGFGWTFRRRPATVWWADMPSALGPDRTAPSPHPGPRSTPRKKKRRKMPTHKKNPAAGAAERRKLAAVIRRHYGKTFDGILAPPTAARRKRWERKRKPMAWTPIAYFDDIRDIIGGPAAALHKEFRPHYQIAVVDPRKAAAFLDDLFLVMDELNLWYDYNTQTGQVVFVRAPKGNPYVTHPRTGEEVWVDEESVARIPAGDAPPGQVMWHRGPPGMYAGMPVGTLGEVMDYVAIAPGQARAGKRRAAAEKAMERAKKKARKQRAKPKRNPRSTINKYLKGL